MKAAISRDADQVAMHFGRCESYEVVEIENGEPVSRETVENPGHKPGALPRMMEDMEVDCVVAGGMGPRAQNLFDEYDISTIVGVSGDIDETVQALANDELEGGEDQCHH